MVFLLMVPSSPAEFSITFFNHLSVSKMITQGDTNGLTGCEYYLALQSQVLPPVPVIIREKPGGALQLSGTRGSF